MKNRFIKKKPKHIQPFTIWLLIKLILICYATNKRAKAGTHISLLLQLPSSCSCSSGSLCNLCAHFELGSGEGQCADSVCARVGGREGEARWLQQLVSLPLDGEVGRQVPCCASAVLCSPKTELGLLVLLLDAYAWGLNLILNANKFWEESVFPATASSTLFTLKSCY